MLKIPYKKTKCSHVLSKFHSQQKQLKADKLGSCLDATVKLFKGY